VDIHERLLDDGNDGALDALARPAFILARKANLDPRAAGEPSDECAQRVGEMGVGSCRWMQNIGKRSEVMYCPVEGLAELHHHLVGGKMFRTHQLLKPLDSERSRHEVLTGGVVKFSGNPTPLGLARARKLGSELVQPLWRLLHLYESNREGGGVRDRLQQFQLRGRDLPRACPVSTHGCNGRLLVSHWDHGQAAHKRRSVRVLRNARVCVDVRNDSGFFLRHAPSGNARAHGEPASLPERRNCILFRVVAKVAISKDEGDTVGVQQGPRRLCGDLHDFGNRARNCQPAHDRHEGGNLSGTVPDQRVPVHARVLCRHTTAGSCTHFFGAPYPVQSVRYRRPISPSGLRPIGVFTDFQ
jgi:hypothetical protein